MRGPLDLVRQIADLLEELDVRYALGGSMASSILGEPRSTLDVDMAVRLDEASGEALLARVEAGFYVPIESARRAIDAHSSFNLVDTSSSLKVDLFVVGEGLLDRRQLERRISVPLPPGGDPIWVTSPEDLVLRKLDSRRQGGSRSDRQWRDALGILRVHRGRLDVDYLRATAGAVGLRDDVELALSELGLS